MTPLKRIANTKKFLGECKEKEKYVLKVRGSDLDKVELILIAMVFLLLKEFLEKIKFSSLIMTMKRM